MHEEWQINKRKLNERLALRLIKDEKLSGKYHKFRCFYENRKLS